MKHLTRLLMISILTLSAYGLGGYALSGAAFAQGSAAEYESALESAIDDYDSLMIDEARQTLEEAVNDAEREGASGTPVAKLYVMLAIVEFAESGDAEGATVTFTRALEHDYDVGLPAVYSTPKLTEAFEEARGQVEPPVESEGAGGANTSNATGFSHDTVRSARAGESVTLEISVPEDMPVYRVFLNYRRFGETDYHREEMQTRGATDFEAEIDGARVRTSQIEYYIQAFDRSEELIGHAGSQNSPLVMAVLGSGGTLEDEKLDAPAAPSGDDEQKVYVNLGGGSGLGMIFGGEPTGHPDRDVSAGLAPAFGHALLEAGYKITPRAHVGLYMRWQFAPAQDFDQIPAESKRADSFLSTREECLGLGLPGDCLVGLKYRYFFAETDTLKLYSSIGGGIGRIRQWLQLKEPYYEDDGSSVTAQCSGKDRINGPVEYCYIRDTVRPGWAHVGFGAGLLYPVHEHISLMADGYLTLLLPETGLNLDVNLGLSFGF